MTQNAESKCDGCRVAKKKCNPNPRTWDEHNKIKCNNCDRSGKACGPNKTAWESSCTKRGAGKRKISDDPQPEDSSRPHPNLSTDLDRGSTSQQRIRIDGSPIDGSRNVATIPRMSSATYGRGLSPAASLLIKESEHLLSDIMVIIQGEEEISLLEKDLRGSKCVATVARSHAVRLLHGAIHDRLKCIVNKAELGSCSTETELVSVQDIIKRCMSLTRDPGTSKRLLALQKILLRRRIDLERQGIACCKEHEGGHEGRIAKLHYLRRTEESGATISNESSRNPSPGISPAADGSTHHDAGSSTPTDDTEVLPVRTVSKEVWKTSTTGQRTSRHEHQHVLELYASILFGTEDDAQSCLDSVKGHAKVQDFLGRNELHIAAQAGRVELVHPDLLKTARILERRDDFNMKPIMLACLYGHLDSCRRLIDAGCDTQARHSSGRNLLSIAARAGHSPIVRYLLKELDQAKRFPAEDESGMCSPVYDAVESGDAQSCEILLQDGTSFYFPDLVSFAEKKNPKLVPLLQQYRFRPTGVQTRSMTNNQHLAPDPVVEFPSTPDLQPQMQNVLHDSGIGMNTSYQENGFDSSFGTGNRPSSSLQTPYHQNAQAHQQFPSQFYGDSEFF